MQLENIVHLKPTFSHIYKNIFWIKFFISLWAYAIHIIHYVNYLQLKYNHVWVWAGKRGRKVWLFIFKTCFPSSFVTCDTCEVLVTLRHSDSKFLCSPTNPCIFCKPLPSKINFLTPLLYYSYTTVNWRFEILF